MTMTREYAIKEGFINEIESDMDLESAPYIRITHWYGPEEDWMLYAARKSLIGCDVIVVVSENRQAIYRNNQQVRAVQPI